MLNYGSTLFFGNYEGIENIRPFSADKQYNAGEWFYNPSNKNIYQVCNVIPKNSSIETAIKSSYRVDIYIDSENIPSNSLVLKTDGDNTYLYQHKENGEDVKVTSYPIYADFVYETEELLLTITGTTQTLRESNIQLDVQDNSLINSLIDKLLYSVRLN